MNEIEVSLNPIGRDEIHKLEYCLLIGTLSKQEILDEILKNPEERLTWIDSLAVAAAAFARQKANMTISQIAEELGRTEATIRNHLTGKTKAGQLVRETYEKFVKEGVKLELFTERRYDEERKKREELEKEFSLLKEKLSVLKGKLIKIKDNLESLSKEIP
ncbi:MAG: transcriptional regulator [Nitrososphaeria archaeon]|nr:transcriptional regulator [Nitrososphaeria archaeon]